MTFSQIDEDGEGLKLNGPLSLFGVDPVDQQTTASTTTGFTAGSGTTVVSGSTFTGDFGTAAYTIGSVVRALKKIGVLAKDA